MAYQGRYQNGDEKKVKASGGALKTVLITLLCVVLVIALLLGAAYFFLESKLHKVTQAQFEEKDVSGQDLSALIGNLDETEPTAPVTEETTVPETTVPETTQPDYGESGKIVNILVIGQDSRNDPGEEAKLADGIMLLTLNKETRTLSMTSFLRDSYVKLADYRGHTCGWNRINTSYALGYSWYGDAGAMEMLDLTLEYNYGVTVDGNVEISFGTLKKVVDFMGGVDIDLQGDEYTKMLEYQDMMNEHYEWNQMDKRVELHEGVNTLNGDMALLYARERHMNEADSDKNRTERQRKMLTSMLNKCTTLSPLELNELIDFVLSEIITDISTDDMKMYIKELTPYLFDLTLEGYQIPAEGTSKGVMKELPDGTAGVLEIYDFATNKKLLQAIQSGETPE